MKYNKMSVRRSKYMYTLSHSSPQIYRWHRRCWCACMNGLHWSTLMPTHSVSLPLCDSWIIISLLLRPWAGMSLRAYASTVKPASSQQNWLLLTSLLILSDVPNVKKFTIFSDSLSSLLAINNCHLETGYVQKFITDYSQLSNSGKKHYCNLDSKPYWY